MKHRAMSKILTTATFDGYQRRKDKSVSLRFITQELTSSEVMNIDSTLDQFGIVYFRGEEKMNTEEIDQLDAIDLDVYDEPKSQSQRLRNVLYILWRQDGSKGDFKKYYKQTTDKIIQHFKDKIIDE